MTDQYKKEVAALKLLYPDWDLMDDAQRQARHHNFLWTIQAAVDGGIVEFANDEIERLREVLSRMCWQFDENMNNEDCGPFFDARQDARDILKKA